MQSASSSVVLVVVERESWREMEGFQQRGVHIIEDSLTRNIITLHACELAYESIYSCDWMDSSCAVVFGGC